MRKSPNIEVIMECVTCGDPLVEAGKYTYRLIHKGATAESIGPETPYRGHMADAIRRCADCKGDISHWQDAWADYHGCKACGTEYRFSIGD